MHDIQVREISLNDEQRVRRQMSREKIRINWESVPTVGFMGLLLSVALFVIAKSFWETDIGIVMSMVLGGGLGTALGVYNERRRLKLIPESERRWHLDYIALCDEIEKFSERLEAFRQLALTLDRTQDVDRTLIGKYLAERDALNARMRVFLRAMALERFEAAVAKNPDGRYRDTRDVTEQVFVRRVRIAQEEAEVDALLSYEESPNEEQFRQLEAQYGDDDGPVSAKARRSS